MVITNAVYLTTPYMVQHTFCEIVYTVEFTYRVSGCKDASTKYIHMQTVVRVIGMHHTSFVES